MTDTDCDLNSLRLLAQRALLESGMLLEPKPARVQRERRYKQVTRRTEDLGWTERRSHAGRR